ncbi:MAG: helix-turn-helix domain-containing protein [Hyphomicrobium sp.]
MIFSTRDVHPREKLSYWREVATRGYVEHDSRPQDRQAFTGDVAITSLPGLGLSVFEADAHGVHHSRRQTAHEESGDLLLNAVCDGAVGVFQDGRECLIQGRGLYLVDPARPFELNLRQRSTHIVVKIPRPLLEARTGLASEFTARPLVTAGGLGTIVMGFLELLPAQAEAIDDASGLKIAEQLLDLVALAMCTALERDAALSSPRANALLRFKATVERLLIEPGLKPERVAQESGISVRYANSLLAEEGMSIERYVAERRLERCRGALEDAGQAHRSIGEIAFKWGFSDLSHFGRRFKARYGMTPTEYRRQWERLNAGSVLSPPPRLVRKPETA